MITVLGIGPDDQEYMLQGTHKCLAQADVVIGSSRQLVIFSDMAEEHMKLSRLAELEDYLEANPQKNIVLLTSGDPLLHGIGTWVKNQLGSQNVEIVPGISSAQYMFHQLQMSMNNCYLMSSHGRTPDFDFLLEHPKVGTVTDKVIGPYEIGQEIKKRGLHQIIYVEEELSYPDEQITKYDEQTIENRDYEMDVVVITSA